MAEETQPRGIGRVLDSAFDLYRANFRSIALTSLAILFPAALVAGIAQAFYLRSYLSLVGSVFAGGGPRLTEISDITSWGTLANMAAPILLLSQAYVTACVLSAAPAMMAGHRFTVRQLIRLGWSRVWWLALTGLLVGMLVWIGAIFLVVPGVIVWWRLSLARVVCVVEAVPVDKAMSRSWRLTRGAFWRTAGFALTVAVIVFVLQSAVNVAPAVRQIVATVQDPGAIFRQIPAGWRAIEGLFAALALGLVAPVRDLAWFFWYLDRRARMEGMDIVIAAREQLERCA